MPLHTNIFIPLMKYGYSASISGFITFFVSGILHVFISWKQLGTGLLSSFILHGIIIIIEPYIYPRKRRNKLSLFEKFIRIIIVDVIFLLTLPLYIGLWVQAYPQFGKVYYSDFQFFFDITNSIEYHIPKLTCVYPEI